MKLKELLYVTDYYTTVYISVRELSQGYEVDSYEGELFELPKDFKEKYGNGEVEEVTLKRINTQALLSIEVYTDMGDTE